LEERLSKPSCRVNSSFGRKSVRPLLVLSRPLHRRRNRHFINGHLLNDAPRPGNRNGCADFK